MPTNFFSSLKEVAGSPYALIGYLLLISGWVFISYRNSRLKIISKSIKHLPETDRKSVLLQDYGIYLKEGLTAQDYLKGQRQTYAFIFLLALIILVTVIAVTSVLNFQNFRGKTADTGQAADPHFCAVLDSVVNGIPGNFTGLIQPAAGNSDSLGYTSKLTIPGTRKNTIFKSPALYYAMIYDGGDKQIAYNHYVDFTRQVEQCDGDWQMFPENSEMQKQGTLEYTSFVSRTRKIIVAFRMNKDSLYFASMMISNTDKDH